MSSALIHTEARAALRLRLDTLSNIPTERAWEGFDYAPKPGVPFIEDMLSIDDDAPVSIGAIAHQMSYILTVRYPAGAGTGDLEEVGGRLMDHFKVGTSLEYGVSKLLCTKAARRGSIRQDGAWASMTVTVSITAFTTD
jgi:hypothetical protein